MRESENADFGRYCEKCLQIAWVGSFGWASNCATILGGAALWVLHPTMSLPIDIAGTVSFGIYCFGLAWLVVFIFRILVLAPYQLYKRATLKSNDLQKQLDNKEAKQKALTGFPF